MDELFIIKLFLILTKNLKKRNILKNSLKIVVLQGQRIINLNVT